MTIVYVFKDGALRVASNQTHARQAFDQGGLPLFLSADDDAAMERLEGRMSIVGGMPYLTELMDRPFADVDELLALKATFAEKK